MKFLKLIAFSLLLLNLSSCAKAKTSKLECKEVKITDSRSRTVCFPKGKICRDPHGIGDGKPIVIDCFTGGSRMCHRKSKIWPECAGGKFL